MSRIFSALCLVFWSAGPCAAGLYDPAQPGLDIPGTPLDFEVFRDRMAAVILPANSTLEKNTIREKALVQRAELQKLPNPTTNDLVRRGILALRLGDFDAGFADLQSAYRVDRNSFFALTALATAHQQAGQYSDAVYSLQACRELLPDQWPTPELSPVLRQVEAAQLQLAGLRLREQSQRLSRSQPVELDELLGVRFVGPSGGYEAGTIAPDERAKIPPHAIATVQQLLLWLPGDSRLYWYLGELYNAHGDLDAASAIFDECLNSRALNSRTLMEHRRVVQDAIKAKALSLGGEWMPTGRQWLIAAAVVVPIVVGLIYFQFREIGRRLRRRPP